MMFPGRSFRVMFLFGISLLAACSAQEQPRPPRPKPTQPRRVPTQTSWEDRPLQRTPDPMPTPGRMTREAEIQARGGVIIPPDADLGEPLPTPTATTSPEPTLPPLPGTPAPTPEVPVVASIPKDESLLPRIKPETPGKEAAALRMVEDARKLIDAQQYDQATERLERAVSIDPSSSYGYFYLARVKLLRRDLNQAVAFSTRAVSLSGRADRGWQSRVYTLQGEIFEQVGRFRDARTSYAKAIQADPTNGQARVGSARVNPGQPQ